jgi:hypothetical protein
MEKETEEIPLRILGKFYDAAIHSKDLGVLSRSL